MPAKEKPDQARLTSTRMADNSHMASCLDREVNPLQNRVPGRAYTYSLHADGDTPRGFFLGADERRSKGLANHLNVALLPSPEGFEQAQSHVVLARVLPHYKRYLLSKDGEIEGPVDKE